MPRLTEDAVKRFQRPAGGQSLLWDDLVSGFGVRFTPTATAFVVQWRRPDGSKVRKTLARWPGVSVIEARDLARSELFAKATGKGVTTGTALRVAMRAWCTRELQLGSWRPSFARKVDSLIRTYIEGEPSSRLKLTPAALEAIHDLGRRSIDTVTRKSLMDVVDLVTPTSAESLMAVVCMFYNSQVDRGLAVANPARNRLKVTGGRRIRDRRLEVAEFRTLWQAFQGEGGPAATAFAVLAFTGSRRREVTQMRWGELNLDAATWTLPADRRKTGRKNPEPFVINLHPFVADALRRQQPLQGSPFVFWGRRDHRPFDFHHAMLDRLRKSVDVQNWRIHDLRRFARSGMAQLGVTQMVAELCLGHSTKTGLVRVYDQHDYAEEMRAAWLRWGDRILEILS